MQCQGICEDKKNNYELSGVQYSDFPCVLFSSFWSLLSFLDVLGCRGGAGEGGMVGPAGPWEMWGVAAAVLWA